MVASFMSRQLLEFLFFPFLSFIIIYILQMDTIDFSNIFSSNSKKLNVALECHFDKSSSDLRANAILTHHVFDSKSVIN